MADELREDIAAAKNKMTSALGSNREIKRLQGHLWEGERVRMMASGLYGGGNGLLTVTDQRLLFTLDGMTKKIDEDFPFSKISSIQNKTGMMMASITIFASGNKAEV